MRESKRLFSVLILAVLVAGCGGTFKVEVVNTPTPVPTMAVTASRVAEATAATPLAASTGTAAAATSVGRPTPGSTATDLGTARTATPIPLPSPEEVLQQYDEEIRPLVDKLNAAQEAPPDFQPPPPGEWQIRLVPLDDRLYYVQTLLYPQRFTDDGEAQTQLLVGYSYVRGQGLTRFPEATGTETEEVIVESRLFVEQEGSIYSIEEKQGIGGEGSASYEALVAGAVEPLEALESEAERVETVLEAIVGYSIGVDWDPSLGHDVRIALLQWALTSPNWSDRTQAAETLGDLGPEAGDAAPSLVEALADGYRAVRSAAAQALGKIGPREESVSAVIQLLDSADWQLQQAAVRAVREIGPQAREAVPALIGLLSDDGWGTRMLAAEALGSIGPEAGKAVTALIQSLEDEDSSVRGHAAGALGNIGPEAEAAIPALIQALEDKDSWVRWHSAEALGMLGPAAIAAVPALIERLAGDEHVVHRASTEALKAITGQDLGWDVAAWQQWWEENQ